MWQKGESSRKVSNFRINICVPSFRSCCPRSERDVTQIHNGRRRKSIGAELKFTSPVANVPRMEFWVRSITSSGLHRFTFPSMSLCLIHSFSGDVSTDTASMQRWRQKFLAPNQSSSLPGNNYVVLKCVHIRNRIHLKDSHEKLIFEIS